MSITSIVNYSGGLRTECTHVRSGSSITTDAPVDNHGNGARFSPTDLMATSLAACMITVMGIKAEHRGISFNDIRAEVTKVMESNPRRIHQIHVVLTIRELWTEKEKKIMEHTAHTCPVANSLHPDLEQKLTFNYV